MQARAEAKYIRMSPRKVRLVVDLIRGMGIQEARHQLAFSRKAAAGPVLKVLNSAIANAENNMGLNTEDFRVVEARVNDGPTIKRFMPRAHGRATPLRKRMSHIAVAVGDGKEEIAAPREEKATKRVAEVQEKEQVAKADTKEKKEEKN